MEEASNSAGRKRPFVCSECSKAYMTQGLLEKHCRKKHQQECRQLPHCVTKAHKVFCGLCSEEVAVSRVYRHMVCFHLQSAVSVCRECGIDVEASSLLSHFAEAHGAVKCLLCGRKFRSQFAYAMHFKCHISLACSVATSPDSSKRRHPKSGTVERKHTELVCGICEQSFKYGSDLYRHLLKHETKVRGRMGICVICWSTMPQVDVMKHKQECRAVRKACALTSPFKALLDKDITVKRQKDEPLRSSSLALSGDSCSLPQSLSVTHSATSLCGIDGTTDCDKETRTAATQKPLVCGLCERTFAKTVKFYHHIVRHSSTITHNEDVCRLCGSIVRTEEASKHRNEHGELQCKRCGKFYLSMKSLNIHITAVHLGCN